MLAGAGFLVWRSSTEKSQFTTKVEQAAASQAVEAGSTVQLHIDGYAFHKDIIKVKKGTKVTWANHDSAKHTVTSDQGRYLASTTLGSGGSYEKVFDQTGVYTYHCDPHPNMHGAVIVVD